MVAVDIDEAERRRLALIEQLNIEAQFHAKGAFWANAFVSGLFFSSVIFAGLAIVAGIVKIDGMPTWVISLLTALGTGSTLLSQRGRFQQKANWFYDVRDTAQKLIYRLQFEMPHPVTLQDVATVSKDWGTLRDQLSAKMAAINGASEVQSPSELPKKPQV